MASLHILSFMLLLTQQLLMNCATAVAHSRIVDNMERESDGSYRPRDFDHYSDSGHNSEFDHEAILGSVREAEEYDKLSPEESRKRLALLLPRMDVNGDKVIDRMELKNWIMNSFLSLSREEAEERMSETDDNHDGAVSWTEYLQDAFAVSSEQEVGPDDTGETGMVGLLHEEKTMWVAADNNGDGKLDINEFEVFINPEEHEKMHPFIVNQTMREKDANNDGVIDFNEFIGEKGSQQDKAWLVAERDKFDHELDSNRDGALDSVEVQRWVIPDNEEIADEEVEHLFLSADDDRNDVLTFEEVLLHHDVFVGSEAAGHGGHLDDEL